MILKEREIRPQDLIKKCDKLHAKDVTLFFANQNDFIKVSCPACNSSNYNHKFDKGIFKFYECSRCGTLFINPRPSSEQLSSFYKNSKSIDFWSKHIFPVSEKARTKNIFIPRAKLIVSLLKEHHVGKIETMLEIGPGYGSFLEVARDLKLAKNFLAVEPSRPAAQKCRKRGFDVFEEMIENVNLEKKVDLVVNFELIEHLFNPKSFIKVCNKMLKKKGLFILTTPNIKGFDLMTLGKLSNNITGPNHLNYFNPKSLSRLLEDCGFEVLDVKTPGKLDAEIVRNKILSGDFTIDNQSFLKHVLITEWESLGEQFQRFLANNLLSSHLWIIARKV